jgi:hypothetical protein
MWAIVHVEMRRVPRVRAVLDFVARCYAEEADLIEGRRPLPAAGQLTSAP